MRPCNCYYGEDCTKTTVCANEAIVEDLEEKIKLAFLAGFDAGSLDAFEGGEIIDPSYYEEVTEEAFREWEKSL